MSPTPKLRVLDLFSGIGGFSLGLEMTGGFETVQFVEQDEKCQRVLRKHWPEVPIHGDIKTYEPSGAVDVVCGGFPCQPFSVAGQQRGAEDDRHLWPEMCRVIERSRPTWVVGENVAGIIRLALDQVLSDLEVLGYACRAFVVPACAVDAPHRRDRVWIVAHANGEGLQERPSVRGVDRRQAKRHTRENASICCGWTAEPPVGRVADGIPGRVDRLRQLGNAVVPQVVAQIGYAILAAHESD